jgi:hypothetical protein
VARRVRQESVANGVAERNQKPPANSTRSNRSGSEMLPYARMRVRPDLSCIWRLQSYYPRIRIISSPGWEQCSFRWRSLRTPFLLVCAPVFAFVT